MTKEISPDSPIYSSVKRLIARLPEGEQRQATELHLEFGIAVNSLFCIGLGGFCDTAAIAATTMVDGFLERTEEKLQECLSGRREWNMKDFTSPYTSLTTQS